jgi:predicted aspartyl protease
MRYPILLCVAGIAATVRVRAAHFDLKGKRTSPFESIDLQRRDGVQGVSLNDSADISYTCNITLSGVPFTVLIDTGRYIHF